MLSSRSAGLLLVTPALLVIGGLFVFPLGYSIVDAFTAEVNGVERASLANFVTAFELYTDDILFTILIIGLSTVMIGLGAAKSRRTIRDPVTRISSSPSCALTGDATPAPIRTVA